MALTHEEKARIVRARLRGASAEVAEEFGVSPGTIASIMTKHPDLVAEMKKRLYDEIHQEEEDRDGSVLQS